MRGAGVWGRSWFPLTWKLLGGELPPPHVGHVGRGPPAALRLPTAFEDMLENPLNSTQWMNDPETGPVMLQISRIFQTLNRA